MNAEAPPRKTIADLLEAAAERHGPAPFVTDVRTGATHSYADLRRNSDGLAALLAGLGAGPGSRVVFLTRNDTIFFPLWFACARRGATLVPLNRETLAGDLGALLEHAGATIVLTDDAGKAAGLDSIAIAWDRHVDPAPADEIPAEEDAIVVYTSGTSGFAKGVVLTHRNLLVMAEAFVGFYGLRPGQRFVSMLPYYHINAPMITGLVCAAAGAHVFVTDLFRTAHVDTLLRTIESHRIQVLSATPSILAALLRHAADRLPTALGSLQFCFCGTAALPEKVWRDFESVAGVPVYQGYGLTETTTWATMIPPTGPRRYDSVGVPVASEIRIEGSSPGEVMIRGEIVMKGYLNDPGLTERSFSDGWYRSGDLGYFDEDGHLVLVGRAKNIIKRRGVLVYPDVVDEVLRRSELVEDACTVGIADEAAGERIVSGCVLRRGTLDDVRRHIAETLSRQIRPDELREIGFVARNEMGKPAVNVVRDILSGRLANDFVAAFDRYEYRRAQTPDLDAIRALVDGAIRGGSDVRFVGFWGVGARAALAAPDEQAMARLGDLRAQLNRVVRNVPTEARFMLWLADVHARGNRIPDDRIDRYLGEVAALAQAHGIETRRLSDIWAAAGLEADAAETLQRDPDVQAAWRELPLRPALVTQATLRCHCPNHSEQCAFRYYCTRLVENPALARMFEGSIQFTYSRPAQAELLPKLPTLYWHSTKAGRSTMPWFS